MMCLDVSLNGQRISLAGHSDATMLRVSCECAPVLRAGSVELFGELPPQNDKIAMASWGTYTCRVGDELTIRVVESSQAVEPVVILHEVGEIVSDKADVWPICSLCGKSYHDVHMMMATRRAHVCDSCIDEIAQLRREDGADSD